MIYIRFWEYMYVPVWTGSWRRLGRGAGGRSGVDGKRRAERGDDASCVTRVRDANGGRTRVKRHGEGMVMMMMEQTRAWNAQRPLSRSCMWITAVLMSWDADVNGMGPGSIDGVECRPRSHVRGRAVSRTAWRESIINRVSRSRRLSCLTSHFC